MGIKHAWRDTNLSKNLNLILTGLRKFEEEGLIDSAMVFYHELLRRLDVKRPDLAQLVQDCANGIEKHGMKKGKDHWIPQPDYLVIEAELISILGHPSWLQKLGTYANEVGHGSEKFDAWMLRSGLKYIFGPALATTGIPSGGRLWNDNKRMVAKDHNGYINITTTYVPHRATGEIRDGDSDVFSIMYWILGIMSAFPSHWPDQADQSRVQIIRAPVNIVKFLEKYFDDIRIWNNSLRIDGNQVGTIITDDYGKKVLQINETIMSKCTRTGNDCILVNSGSSFNFSDEKAIQAFEFNVHYKKGHINPIKKSLLFAWGALTLAANILLLSWNWHLGRWLLNAGFLKAMLGATQEEVERKNNRDLAEIERTNAARLLGRTFIPSSIVYHNMINGNFKKFNLNSGILFWDTVDSTSLSKLLDLDQYADLSTELQNFALECFNKYGCIYLKSAGDGGTAYSTCGYEGDDRRNDDPEEHAKMVSSLIKGALYFHRNLHTIVNKHLPNYEMKIRVGISFGKCAYRIVNEQLDIMSPTVIRAARLEQACPKGGTLVAREGMDVLAMGEFEKNYPKNVRLREYAVSTAQWDQPANALDDIFTIDAIDNGTFEPLSTLQVGGEKSPIITPEDAFQVGDVFFKPGGSFDGKTHIAEAYEVHPITPINGEKNSTVNMVYVPAPKQLTAS